MGDWVIGAFINLFGSIAINFGTNLLKLGHNERERHSMMDGEGMAGKEGCKVNHAVSLNKPVFDALRTTMFILGMVSVFAGISLLAPDEPRGGEVKDASHPTSVLSSSNSTETDSIIVFHPLFSYFLVGSSSNPEDAENKEMKSFTQRMVVKVTDILAKAKTTCSLSLGFGDDSINASAVLVMPMMSSKITGFRGSGFDRSRTFSLRNSSWSRVAMDEESAKMLNGDGVLPQSP
ncbi:hypothetical protein GOBAR_DD29118 [Gossypium barbadense]|nr:hypothetical protein GOBAR_DD29118 [Gossypium barbadense]